MASSISENNNNSHELIPRALSPEKRRRNGIILKELN